MSNDYLIYKKKKKREKFVITFSQMLILIIFISLWQYLSSRNIINSFIYSSPSKIISTIISLYKEKILFSHIFTTSYEIILSFLISSFLSFILAILLYENKFIYKITEPYLTLFNSLPKVSLGPVIIIIAGANQKSVILMGILLSIIISTLNIYNGFNNTDINKIKLLKTMNASKIQILKFLIIPSNLETIISSLKINMSMSLIGVITGELLVSKKGIGYLITYGSQVFNLNLVFTGITLLMILSYIMYFLLNKIEKILIINN